MFATGYGCTLTYLPPGPERFGPFSTVLKIRVLAQQGTSLDAGVPDPIVELFMQIAKLAPVVIGALAIWDTPRVAWRAWRHAPVIYRPAGSEMDGLR
jgi:hypothetical protein